MNMTTLMEAAVFLLALIAFELWGIRTDARDDRKQLLEGLKTVKTINSHLQDLNSHSHSNAPWMGRSEDQIP